MDFETYTPFLIAKARARDRDDPLRSNAFRLRAKTISAFTQQQDQYRPLKQLQIMPNTIDHSAYPFAYRNFSHFNISKQSVVIPTKDANIKDKSDNTLKMKKISPLKPRQPSTLIQTLSQKLHTYNSVQAITSATKQITVPSDHGNAAKLNRKLVYSHASPPRILKSSHDPFNDQKQKQVVRVKSSYQPSQSSTIDSTEIQLTRINWVHASHATAKQVQEIIPIRPSSTSMIDSCILKRQSSQSDTKEITIVPQQLQLQPFIKSRANSSNNKLIKHRTMSANRISANLRQTTASQQNFISQNSSKIDKAALFRQTISQLQTIYQQNAQQYKSQQTLSHVSPAELIDSSPVLLISNTTSLAKKENTIAQQQSKHGTDTYILNNPLLRLSQSFSQSTKEQAQQFKGEESVQFMNDMAQQRKTIVASSILQSDEGLNLKYSDFINKEEDNESIVSSTSDLSSHHQLVRRYNQKDERAKKTFQIPSQIVPSKINSRQSPARTNRSESPVKNSQQILKVESNKGLILSQRIQVAINDRSQTLMVRHRSIKLQQDQPIKKLKKRKQLRTNKLNKEQGAQESDQFNDSRILTEQYSSGISNPILHSRSQSIEIKLQNLDTPFINLRAANHSSGGEMACLDSTEELLRSKRDQISSMSPRMRSIKKRLNNKKRRESLSQQIKQTLESHNVQQQQYQQS